MSAAPADQELSGVLLRAQAGDGDARNQLLAALYDRLRRLTRVLLRTFPTVQRRRDEDSVANDLALKLIAALDAGLPAETTADLFRFAGVRLRQLLIDEANKLARRGTPVGGVGVAGDSSGGGGPDPATASLDPAVLAEWTEFHRRIERLAPDRKAVFDLLFFYQMPQTEVATVLGLPPKQVSRHWLAACDELGPHLPTMG